MIDIREAGAAPVTGARAQFVPKRIFLTGAGGYVGRNLITHLTATGSEVVGLVRSHTSAELVRSLGAVPFRGDLLASQVIDGMEGCDVLVHAAADTDHGPPSPEQRRTNEEGTRNVLAAARAAGVTRAIHISSESVLADGRAVVNADESRPLPRRPAGGYSRSKAVAEAIALSYNGAGLEVIVVRPRFVWGRDDTTALPQLVAAARSGRMAWISGGTYLTSTTHITNLCRGIELVLAQGRAGEVYFITDGEPIEFRRFVSGLLETQGVPAPQKSVPRALMRALAITGDLLGTLSRGRIAGPLTLQVFATSAVEVTLDIGKARTELGYQPVVSREQGLAELRAGRWGSRTPDP
ncbi:NAD-dependent epimerase/dehydratase family protein [Devosia nitrariae]|uniref:Epimerase n=1 Tax=Devosia nitrariae TaxID=2071872 RepID=A0ABQ5W1M6_9HYPH|nr:NAD-dependent epimerase/dehydratase family protein [Devosia nitrariae]GLQ53714.1 epimerase [Devosia nitrariae]